MRAQIFIGQVPVGFGREPPHRRGTLRLVRERIDAADTIRTTAEAARDQVRLLEEREYVAVGTVIVDREYGGDKAAYRAYGAQRRLDEIEHSAPQPDPKSAPRR